MKHLRYLSPWSLLLEAGFINRRSFLRYGTGVVAGAATTSLPLMGCQPSKTAVTYANDPIRPQNFTNPLFIPGAEGPFGVLAMAGDAPLTLKARAASFPILNGQSSPFLIYETRYLGKSYQNPILRVRSESRIAITLDNGLNQPTIIHWHGLHVPANMDGHPNDTIASGKTYPYQFRVKNRSGTYWYHTHAHHLTAQQAYGGLASFFIVEDDDELKLARALDLKLGETDLPLVIQDKRFNAAGELVYQPNPMEKMMGYLGDIVLVNLTPNAMLEIGPRIYRLRCLNGSNARVYKLAFMRDAEALTYQVIGTDGGLLDKPYPTKQAFLAPGERLDVLFDASVLRLGETVFLKSLAFDPMENDKGMGGMGGMMGMGGSARLADGAEFNLLKLVISKNHQGPRELPQRLSNLTPLNTTGIMPRRVHITMGHMQWLINDESYRPNAAAFEVHRGIEVWDIQNAQHSMLHPMHLHGFSFQVLGRSNSPAALRPLAIAGNGRTVSDLGWKDTVLIWPAETVRIALDFGQAFAGAHQFLFHCHNLEHEDAGMMVNYAIPS